MIIEDFIKPDWPAPANIVALATTRLAPAGLVGASGGTYASFNLGDHVDDDAASVQQNRAGLLDVCDGLQSIVWLQQVHGVDVHCASGASPAPIIADASIAAQSGLACGIMTADCLPVLFCRLDGGQVAAAHAGWRGLCAGVLANTVKSFDCPPQELMAWIGPAISAAHFEVGAEVYQAFIDNFGAVSAEQITQAFTPSVQRAGHFYADLNALASAQLQKLGVAWVGSSNMCTFTDANRFYSFRRDGQTGRQLSLIYIK
ncbi:peptidoglycan editing factor PgeF [Zhongshania sp.]|uniref:peptidoglycan editing factor PgeF n=1 Tax=Zhongshania sp. TaxID=1971902 RepID=UPI001B62B6E9|nr:peptidoglycan editing factor PgeF [Zhongshania sp.]MBQ0796591.1 peptidoglycan editing factor PgeF [Zhongshania sp.]